MTYDRLNPFHSAIKERYLLTKPGSKKNTQHVVLDLAGSDISFKVGDSIGVYPQNDPQLVERMLRAMRATGDEIVHEKRSEKQWVLRDFLREKGNLAMISKKLFKEVSERQTNPKKKAHLEEVDLKSYLHEREIWDFLEENEEVVFEPQELCDLMMPLLPRLYSIANSPLVTPDEVHFTVALLEYETNGRKRQGVCTHYLCDLAPMHQKCIPIYLQPTKDFTLPDPSANIIMVGPGTGIAPFRAFMQERIAQKASGKNWLFFGEWNRATDYFYEEEWGDLRIDLAFSRDQAHKIYVQHRMLEHGAELYQWLQEGGYLFVCGDAERMAKDVDLALHQIVEEHGRLSPEEAKAYVKDLRVKEKRYLRDVY